ncbi:50S ribosomal protein L35 [Phycisphaerae bacterium RAS2]|nr:50S ribosomal protein L35 [Phycisphaerae bacterium RAS2]
MPKMKRHKGLAKRVKVTASGKVKYRKANMGHLMSGKGGNRRRRLTSKGILANKALSRKIATALQA